MKVVLQVEVDSLDNVLDMYQRHCRRGIKEEFIEWLVNNHSAEQTVVFIARVIKQFRALNYDDGELMAFNELLDEKVHKK